jgi:accessory gene regulator protein AgrB
MPTSLVIQSGCKVCSCIFYVTGPYILVIKDNYSYFMVTHFFEMLVFWHGEPQRQKL